VEAKTEAGVGDKSAPRAEASGRGLTRGPTGADVTGGDDAGRLYQN